MQKFNPTSRYERMLQQPEPVLTSGARRELRLQGSLDAATEAVAKDVSRKEASSRAEAVRVKARVEEELGKVVAGVKGLRVPRPADAAGSSSRAETGWRARAMPSGGEANKMNTWPAAAPAAEAEPKAVSSLTSSMLSARAAKALIAPSSCSNRAARAAAPREEGGNIHRRDTAARGPNAVAAVEASPRDGQGRAVRGHFSTGFPTPYTDSGFKSVTQWAKVSYEEAQVMALGPQGSVEQHRSTTTMPNRLLVSVACYLLNETLTRDTTLAPLWATLRTPIFDAVFSPQLIGDDMARRAARREQQGQRHQPGVGASEHASRHDTRATATTEGEEEAESEVAAPKHFSKPPGLTRGEGAGGAEDGTAPVYPLRRDGNYTAMAEYTDYRLWCEEVQGARDDNGILLDRIGDLKKVIAHSHLVLQMAQRRVERTRLQGIFSAWRAHAQRASRLRETAVALITGAARRAREEACFLRWRRITVAGRAHRLREAIASIQRDMKDQHEAHRVDMQNMKAQLQAESAAHAAVALKNETLRGQMAESYSLECSVLHAALKKTRERAAQFQTHARRWERLAKTFRPQVLCPAVTPQLLQLGRQLRGWERDLAGRVVLAQRPPGPTGGGGGTTVGLEATQGKGGPDGAVATTPRGQDSANQLNNGKDTAFSSVFMRQAAVTAVLERFLLRWVNFVMYSASKGGGGVEAQAQLQHLLHLQHEQQLRRQSVRGSRTSEAVVGGRDEDSAVASPFSFWVPVKTLEPKKVPVLSAKQAAEDRAKAAKNDGVASSRIKAALKGERKVAKEKAEAAATEAEADEGPSNHFSLFTLRCLVCELLRQFEAQHALMACVDTNPVSAPVAATTTTTAAVGKRAVQGPGTHALSKPDDDTARSSTFVARGPPDGDVEHGGDADGNAGAVSLVTHSPWREELEAVRAHKALFSPASTVRPVSSGPATATGAAVTLGNQRDALGLIPYLLHTRPAITTTSMGGGDGAVSASPKSPVTFASDVANLDVSANVISYLSFLGSSGGGEAASYKATIAAATEPSKRSGRITLDPVFSDLAQLLIAFSSGGLYPPLLIHAKGGPGTPTPTAEQLRSFLYPSRRVARYNHTAMLWVLASLFTGYARCFNGPDPFLPSTDATPHAARGKRGRKSGRVKAALLADGTAVAQAPEPGRLVLPPNSRSAASRPPSPGESTTTATTEAKGTHVVASHTILTRSDKDPKTETAKTRDRSTRVVSIADSSPNGANGPHPIRCDAKPHSTASSHHHSLSTATGAADPLGGMRHLTAATATTTMIATEDDTMSDMDVYLGLRDPDVPISDSEGNELEEAEARERADAELEAALADVTDAEERDMQRRRHQRLRQSGLLSTKEAGGVQSLRDSLAHSAAVQQQQQQQPQYFPAADDANKDEDGYREIDYQASSPSLSSTTSSDSEGVAASHMSLPFVSRSAKRKGGAGQHDSSSRVGRRSVQPSASVAIRTRDRHVSGLVGEEELAAREADFWREDPVTEGIVPAPADVGADSDADEDIAGTRLARGSGRQSKRAAASSASPAAALPSSLRSRDTAAEDGAQVSGEEDEDDPRMRRQQRILRHFPFRSRAFDGAAPSGSHLPFSARRKSANRSLRLAANDGGGGGAATTGGGFVVGERTERRRKAHRRRRALCTFVELTVTDRERRQQWLALARVVTALTTRLGVLDIMPKGKRRAPSSAGTGRKKNDDGDGPDWAELEASWCGSSVTSSRAGSRAGSASRPGRAHPNDGRLGGGSPSNEREIGGGATQKDGHGSAGAPVGGAVPDSSALPTTAASSRTTGDPWERLSSARAANGGKAKPNYNEPDPYFPSLANRGPAAPPPQPRPPSPPLTPQGPLDPVTVRAPPSSFPSHAKGLPQHHSAGSKLYFDIQSRHSR